MSTPASVHQASKFLRDALGDPDSEQMQYLLANSKFFRQLAFVNFSKLNEGAFTAALTPDWGPSPWRPVGEYADKIAEWNELRGWGFTEKQIAKLATDLEGQDHLDLMNPTGVSLWLGKTLGYNWQEVREVLQIEVEARGGKFPLRPPLSKVVFRKGSEQSGGRKLSVALLDLATYWASVRGVVPNDALQKETRLPGLEVAWLLALNPEVFERLDGENLPGLFGGGLVVAGSEFIPLFLSGNLYREQTNYPQPRFSAVRFRK